MLPVAARAGATGQFGGWSLVIVYKNDLQPMRNLTVFDGLESITNAAGNNINNISRSGFITPLAGPVTF